MARVVAHNKVEGRAIGAALMAAGLGLGGWSLWKRSSALRKDLKDGKGLKGLKGLFPRFKKRRADGRGRLAESPAEIPRRGWKDIAIRTVKEFSDDEIPLIAAGVTFYTLLAIFPGVGAFAALYGLFGDVAEAQKHIQTLSYVLPGGAITLIGDQMKHVMAAGKTGLSLAFVGGLAVSIWSANGAIKAIITGLNIAYDEKEKRGFIRKTLTSLALTVGFLLFVLASAFVMAARPAVEATAGPAAGVTFTLVAWPAMLVGLALGLALLYRFGPSRDRVKWRWISWGSGLAAVAWLLMSAAFSFYVSNFGRFDATYGSLGAAVGFMTWTWLSSMVILLGGELNSEIEHQTARDTTVGAPRPLGLRGATMADTVGAAQ